MWLPVSQGLWESLNSSEIPESNCPLTTGWWPETWGQVNLIPQSPTVPLTSWWVHWRESQDAPVIGIERIRRTPQPADMVGTTPSYDSVQHSSNRCARGLSRETAYGVQALDTWRGFSKLCLLCTCRMKLSIKHFLHNINKETRNNHKEYGKPSWPTWQELNEDRVHILGAQKWPENPTIKQREYKVKYNRSPGNKMVDPSPEMSFQCHLHRDCDNHDCEDQCTECPVSKHLAISKQRCILPY